MKRPIPPLRIVLEDDDLLVVDKPPGLLSSSGARDRRQTLVAMVTEHLALQSPRARVGLIHRLDRDASGLLVFSKNPRAYHSLKRQLYHRTVSRVYYAIVHGLPQPPAGRIESRLVERPDGSVRSTRSRKGELAISEYETVRTVGGLSLVRVTLNTGRKHQIRVHLRERGTPIVGDPLYSSQPHDVSRMMLVAIELSFDHPRSGKRIDLKIRLPESMRRLFREP